MFSTCRFLTLHRELPCPNRGGHPLLLARQELKDQCPSLPERDAIRWVITVPAIWKQPAKQFMREAAYKVRGRLFCTVTLEGGRAFGGVISFPPSPVGAASITKGLWHVLAA